MKRSKLIELLAKRLSNRDPADIYELAKAEMAFVQDAILERLPNQPWFLQTEVFLPLDEFQDFATLPSDYNGIMTQGGVWIAEADVDRIYYSLTTPPYALESVDGIQAGDASVEGARNSNIQLDSLDNPITLSVATVSVEFKRLTHIVEDQESVVLSGVSPEVEFRTLVNTGYSEEGVGLSTISAEVDFSTPVILYDKDIPNSINMTSASVDEVELS